MSTTRLRVCTLNVWGLKFIAKDRTQRIAAICHSLGQSDYDIIALQELWVAADYAFVRKGLAKSFPYTKYFYSGALGAGLALFSRFPIVGTGVYPYSLNGSPLDVIGGDWFVGKAAAWVVIDHPLLGEVQLFNTHIYAKGGEGGPQHHQAHRIVNAWELAKLVRQAAELGRHVIACGDYNSVPESIPITIIREHAGLTDAWTACRTNVSLASNPEDAVQVNGITADSPLNSYSSGKKPSGYVREHFGKRLDYVFFRAPLRTTSKRADAPCLKCVDTRVVMTETVPGQSHSYSDHFGLEATFEISTSDVPSPDQDAWTHLSEVRQDANGSQPPSGGKDEHPSIKAETIDSSLSTLGLCYRHSKERSKFCLATFGSSVGMLAVIVVGSAWLPPVHDVSIRSWLNPIVLLVTVAFSWLGTTMLYAGFIYGRWEQNALTNIIEELEVVRSGMD